MKHKLESRWLGEISIIFANILKYADDTTFMAESEEELESFDESERRQWKSWLSIQKTKIMASGPITSWQTDAETVETVRDFIFGGFKITVDGDYD